MSEEKIDAYTVYATTDYVDEQLNSASSSKLISHVLPIEATEENQTIFPINLETFDAANDTILVQDGITLLLPNSGFTIENNTIVMTTPWGLGDTGSILILKNTPILADEVAISGAVIENNSITLDKLSADITTELDEIKKSASDGKALVAGAITDKGIETATDATFEQIATNIGSIVTLENGTDDATVTSDKMLKDVTAYAKGVKVTGSIESLTAATITPGTSAKTIAAGKYLEGAQTITGDTNLVAANIAKGKSIFGVTGTYDPVASSMSPIQLYKVRKTLSAASSETTVTFTFGSGYIPIGIGVGSSATFNAIKTGYYSNPMDQWDINTSIETIPWRAVSASNPWSTSIYNSNTYGSITFTGITVSNGSLTFKYTSQYQITPSILLLRIT